MFFYAMGLDVVSSLSSHTPSVSSDAAVSGSSFSSCAPWLSPGIASLIRLLSSAGEESQPGLAVLLCEILTAVFLSLFVHGMATHSSNELFRIVAHPLNSRLWVSVFGGGARIPVIEKPNSPVRTPPPGERLFAFSSHQSDCLSVGFYVGAKSSQPCQMNWIPIYRSDRNPSNY